MAGYNEIVRVRDLPQYADKQNAEVLEKYGDYKHFNGTDFHPDTPNELVRMLDGWMRSQIRLTFDFGDTKTGQSWEEVWNISGYVNRTSGLIHRPMLVHNQRANSGDLLSTENILTVRPSNKKDGSQFIYIAPILRGVPKPVGIASGQLF